jgi:hypothetical protein
MSPSQQRAHLRRHARTASDPAAKQSLRFVSVRWGSAGANAIPAEIGPACRDDAGMRYRLSGFAGYCDASKRASRSAAETDRLFVDPTSRIAKRPKGTYQFINDLRSGVPRFRRAGRVANRRPNVYAWPGRSARRRQSAPYESSPWRCVGGRNVQEQTQSPHGSAAELAGRADARVPRHGGPTCR